MTLERLRLLFLILGLAFAINGVSQAQTKLKVKTFESEHWITAGSSPLLFKVEERSGEIFIEVHSSGKVAGYQYGCIAVRNDKLVTLKKLGALKIDLTNEEPILYRDNVDLVARTKCKSPGKLGIIAVDFDDGGRWSLNTSTNTKK